MTCDFVDFDALLTLPRYCPYVPVPLTSRNPFPQFYTIIYTLIMLPNRNLRVQNAFTLGSPPPTLACPHCPRHFRSTGGRTKHIRAKHQTDVSRHPDPNQSRPPSPTQSLSQPPPEPPSPVPSNSPTQPPPLRRGFNHADLDTEHPYSDPGYALPESYSDVVNEDPPPAGGRAIPIPPSVTRVYHPKLDGKLIFLKYIRILTFYL